MLPPVERVPPPAGFVVGATPRLLRVAGDGERPDLVTGALLATLAVVPAVALAATHGTDALWYLAAMAPAYALAYAAYLRTRRALARPATVARMPLAGAALTLLTATTTVGVFLVAMLLYFAAFSSYLPPLGTVLGVTEADEDDPDSGRSPMERVVAHSPATVVLIGAALVAYVARALVVEPFKFALVQYMHRAPCVAHPYGLVVHSAAAAAGFAAVDILSYVAREGAEADPLPRGAAHLGAAEAVSSAAMHLVCGLVVGARLANRRWAGERAGAPRIFAVPVLLRGTLEFVVLVTRLYHGGLAPILVAAPVLLASGVRYYWLVSGGLRAAAATACGEAPGARPAAAGDDEASGAALLDAGDPDGGAV